MKILLVYSLDEIASADKPLRNQDQIQFGISYLSSFLKSHNHETSLVVLSEILGATNKKTLVKKIEEFKPDILCMTAVATEFNFIVSVSKYIKANWPSLFIIAGGSHITLNPEEAIKNKSFDAICVGEGEYPLLELASQLENKNKPSKINNFWIRNGDKVEKNNTRPFLEDLDSLPFPDRMIWREWLDEQPGSRPAVLLGRGCPFDCTYCSNHALSKVATGKYYRLRSVKNIIKEIEELAKLYPNKNEMYLEIETIGVDMKWTLDLCDNIANLNKKLNKALSFGINLRIMPNQDYETIFSAFKKANFRFVNIGLESGSERVRKEILNRHYKNTDVIKAVKTARKFNIEVCFYNMIGLPGETKKDFLETLKMNRLCQPDWHWTAIFYPYPGTELYECSKEMGLIKKPLTNRLERFKASLSMPGFSRRSIQHYYIWFDYYVYRGRKPLIKVLFGILSKKLQSTYYFKYYLNWLMTNIGIFRAIKTLIRKKLAGDRYIIKKDNQDKI